MTGELHPEAELEIQESARWYAEQSLLASTRFVSAVQAALEKILSAPDIFPFAGNDVRVLRLKTFPFKIYYEFDEGTQHVRFLCVMHNKRRPDYWRSRTSPQ